MCKPVATYTKVERVDCNVSFILAFSLNAPEKPE
jgi:hypothetical protein